MCSIGFGHSSAPCPVSESVLHHQRTIIHLRRRSCLTHTHTLREVRSTHTHTHTAMGHRCVCTTGTVRQKAEVQSKSRRRQPFSDMAQAPLAAANTMADPRLFATPGVPCNPLCDIPSGCCSFTGPWTVTRSSLRMLRRVAAFCRPLRPVLLPVSFPRSRSPVVGVLGLCWLWHYGLFARQRRPVVGVLGVVLVVAVVAPRPPRHGDPCTPHPQTWSCAGGKPGTAGVETRPRPEGPHWPSPSLCAHTHTHTHSPRPPPPPRDALEGGEKPPLQGALPMPSHCPP